MSIYRGFFHRDGQKLPREERALETSVPIPTSDQGHVAPNVSKGEENWREIRGALKNGGFGRRVRLKCVGCDREFGAIIQDKALFDPHITYLCDECRVEGGYAWGSTITPSEFPRYQLVKVFGDDSLMRLLEKSPNFKDRVHKPVDSVEEATRSLSKRGGGSVNPEDLNKS